MTTATSATVPILSIICVFKDDLDGVRKTLASITGHFTHAIEIVVVENAEFMGQKALELFTQVKSRGLPITWRCGRDSGIYDAMNKGVILSTGSWIWFLNAGDEVHEDIDSARLLDHLSTAAGTAWATGTVAVSSYDRLSVRDKRGPVELTPGEQDFTICHQGVFTSRNGFVTYGLYDVSLKLCADYAHATRMLRDSAPLDLSMRVAHYREDGISSRSVARREWENYRVRAALSGIGNTRTIVNLLVCCTRIARHFASRRGIAAP